MSGTRRVAIFTAWMVVLYAISIQAGENIPGKVKKVSRKPRLLDLAPDNAFLVFSLPDITRLKQNVKNSKSGKLVADPAYAPLTGKILDFYINNGWAENEDAADLRQMLELFQVKPRDLGRILQGEVTFVVFDPPFAAKRVIPDIAAVIEARSEENVLQRLLGIFQGFAVLLMMENNFDVTTETIDGLDVTMLDAPPLKNFQVQICWTITGGRLLLADRIELLKKLAAGMENRPGKEPAGPLVSRSGKKLVKNLGVEPEVFFRFNLSRLKEVKEVADDPKVKRTLEALAGLGIEDIAAGWAVDKSGLMREALVVRTTPGEPSLFLPLPEQDAEISGAFAYLRWKTNPARIYGRFKSLMENIPEGAKNMRKIQRAEAAMGLAVEGDLLAAFDGYFHVYAALPFDRFGMLAGLVPDLVAVAGIKDTDAAGRILDQLESSRQGRKKRWRRFDFEGAQRALSLCSKGDRFDEIEPAVALAGNKLLWSFLYPHPLRRALSGQRNGPPPVSLAQTPLAEIAGDNPGLVLVIDTSALGQFVYNLVDVMGHGDRRKRLIDYRKMPPSAHLEKYLPPTVAIGRQDNEFVEFTTCGPGGLVVASISAGLFFNWIDKATKPNPKEDKAEQGPGKAGNPGTAEQGRPGDARPNNKQPGEVKPLLPETPDAPGDEIF